MSVSPKPYQQPHPPIRVGVTSAESFPILGRMGHDILINPSRVFTLEELKPSIQDYREARKAAGHDDQGKVGLRIPIYLSHDAQKAHDEPMDSALFSMGRLSERVGSYAGRTGTLGDWGAQAERVRGMTYDDWLRDKVAYGTPEAVAEKLSSLGEELGLDQVMFEINFGNLIPLENQANSLHLMMEEVAPNLA
jgi:alkanesulfonate monooxygenase SsuD/methylene tetrahydromethanopterin reductase-like flavin-dependent oxidoreductase (luciferase family)